MYSHAFAVTGYGRKRQGGSALIVTLILLLVITVIGVAGMGSTILQERMAGNMQDSAQVFEATESGLRLCGDHVDGGDSDAAGLADSDELATFQDGGDSLSPAQAELFVPVPDNPLTAKGTTEYQLQCLIEFTGPIDATRIGGSLRRPGAVGTLVGYRVTAAGARVAQGETDTARPTVLLQSDVVVRR